MIRFFSHRSIQLQGRFRLQIISVLHLVLIDCYFEGLAFELLTVGKCDSDSLIGFWRNRITSCHSRAPEHEAVGVVESLAVFEFVVKDTTADIRRFGRRTRLCSLSTSCGSLVLSKSLAVAKQENCQRQKKHKGLLSLHFRGSA